MKIKHNDIIIEESNPFANCKLNRKQYAEVLTTLVQNYANGFVLALNSKWGTGKTTFVKMWEQDLRNNGFKTMYFNAWENDFEMEPMIAFLGEMKSIMGKDDSTFKSLVNKGVTVAKNVLPALAKAVAAKYVDVPILVDAIENTTKAATELLENEVSEYANKKNGLIDFKNELEKYVKEKGNDKSVVFIIDELDRCRPDYAVEVLEKIKHFFSVNGIVFVLSIDKIQLGNSIQGYYGSDKIDTTEYLRRFIDIEYQLPVPDGLTFCDYMYQYYDFHDFYNPNNLNNFGEMYNNGPDFISFAAILFSKHNYTLRQIEKIFSHARIVLTSFRGKKNVFPALLLLLIHIRDFEKELYNNIKAKRLSIQQLVTIIESKFVVHIQNSNQDDLRKYVMTEALLIQFYTNFLNADRYVDEFKLLKINGESEELTFTTIIPSINNKNILLDNLSFIKSYHSQSTVKIDYLLNKIDLLENIS